MLKSARVPESSTGNRAFSTCLQTGFLDDDQPPELIISAAVNEAVLPADDLEACVNEFALNLLGRNFMLRRCLWTACCDRLRAAIDDDQPSSQNQ